MGDAGDSTSDARARPQSLVLQVDDDGTVATARGGGSWVDVPAAGTGLLDLLLLVHPDDRDAAVEIARAVAGAPPGLTGVAALRLRGAPGRWAACTVRFARRSRGVDLTAGPAATPPGPTARPPAASATDAVALALVPVGAVGEDGRFSAASGALCDMLAYDALELLRRHPGALVHPEDRAMAEAAAAVLAAGAREVAVSVRWLRSDGVPLPVMEHRFRHGEVTVVHLATPSPAGVATAVGGDPSMALLDAAPAVLVAVDGDGRITALNRTAAEACGRDAATAVGLSPDAVFPPPAGDLRVSDLVARAVAEATTVSEDIRFVTPDGAVRVLAWLAAPFPSPGEGAALAATDVTERHETLADLAHRALHDPLTRLPNRTLFFERLRHALTRLERGEHELAVLFLDLNHFKEVNDRFGHEAGDRLLQALADRFRAAVRPSDTVARIGGDEFVVLCEDLRDGETAITIVDRLIDAVESPFALDGADARISAAVGVAFARHAGEDADAIVRQADAAMYEAKRKGGPTTSASTAPSTATGPLLIDADQLRAAIDEGGIVVLYQPQIELPAGRIVGVEALVRIQHAELGLLMPASFLPVAEESGLIDRIGAEVVQQVCRQLAEWRDISPDLRVTVNLSARELMATDAASRLDAALRAAGISPDSIIIDVREDVLLANHPDAVRALRELKALGVRISVDDAGIRFTASEALRDLGIDEVKVAGDHVRRLGRDLTRSPVVASIVRLARALELRTVAEGVETEDQLAALRSLGCDAGQGFLFAGPQPAEVIDRLLGPELHWPTDVAAI